MKIGLRSGVLMVRFLALRNRYNLVSAALLVFVVLRALLTCSAEPIVAYANNYDFVRQSSCIGVWEDYGGKDKTQRNPDRPVNSLLFDGDVRKDVCLRSSDNVMPWIVAHIAGQGASVALRNVGVLKIALLAGLLAMLISLAMPPVVRLGLSAAACLLFSDLAVLCYFDTLYLDASAIMFCFIAIALVVAILCGKQPPSASLLLGFLAIIAWLSATKQQYAPFAALTGFVAFGGAWLRWRSSRQLAAGCAGLVLIQFVYFGFVASSNEHTHQIAKANLADTFLEAVLPSAPDKPHALQILGLPPSCASAIGLNWYDARVQSGQLCPEIFHARRVQLLALFEAYPQTFFKPLTYAATFNRPFLLPTIGHFESPVDAGRLRYRVVAATSLSTWLMVLPDALYVWLVACLSLSGPVCLALALRTAASSRRAFKPAAIAAQTLYGFGGTLSLYAIGSAVFGDGYGDLQRHCVGILIGVDCAIGAALIAIFMDRSKEAAHPIRVVRLPDRRPFTAPTVPSFPPVLPTRQNPLH